jgi:hypothetical protein
MKYWFFALLLANAIFFLWEFHGGALQPAETPALSGGEKQILLLRETVGLTSTQRPESARLSPETFASVMAISNSLIQDKQQSLITDAETEAARQAASENNAAAAAEKTPPMPENIRTTQPEQLVAKADEASAGPSTPPVLAPENEATAEAVTEAPATQADTSGAAPAEQSAAVPSVATAALPEAVPLPEAPKAEIMHTSCHAAGKVVNPDALKRLLDRYRPQLTELELSSREKRKNDSYLVYYPPGATLEESIATAEMLRNDYGVSDLLVFRNGELKGAISLGVFSNEQRARLAQSQFEKKGVHAKIMPRYPLEKNYYVRTRWSEQQTAAAKQLSSALKQNYPAPGRTADACGD